MNALRSWVLRHIQACFGTVGRLARSPLATLLTVLVMALAMALPQCLQVLVESARSATGDLAGAISMSVYFKADTSEDKAQQLASQARARKGVARVQLITASQALQEFRDHAGFGAALDALEQNPLPHTLVVTPATGAADPAAVEGLRAFLAAWPETELVQLDAEWVNRFNALLDVLRSVLLVISSLLGAAVIAVVGNTIRLEILNRHTEIEVIKLVGGSNAFVRRPFLYAGALYGLLAAALAWLIVALCLLALRPSVAGLAKAYSSSIDLTGVSWRQLQWLLLVGVALGWLGALLATTRHLAKIQPSA
jgi:cell division transport system permease protein